MRRTLLSLGLILCTVTLFAFMIVRSPDDVVSARLVRVQRGDVHQVAALSGYVRYAEETYAIAPVSGVITQICKDRGERVAAGETIVRINSEASQTVMSAFAAGTEILDGLSEGAAEEHLPITSSAVRTDNAYTVRQILVEEGARISVGTPVARLSSNQQEIICNVSEADLKQLEIGMWAWLSADDEELGEAYIQMIGEASVEPVTGLQVSEVSLIPQNRLALEEGQRIDVDVYLAGSDDVMTLPVNAITDRGTIWWVTNEGRCTEIPAEIVMCNEMLAWVNLHEGLTVAIGEFEEGQRVREAAE